MSGVAVFLSSSSLSQAVVPVPCKVFPKGGKRVWWKMADLGVRKTRILIPDSLAWLHYKPYDLAKVKLSLWVFCFLITKVSMRMKWDDAMQVKVLHKEWCLLLLQPWHLINSTFWFYFCNAPFLCWFLMCLFTVCYRPHLSWKGGNVALSWFAFP